MCCPFTSSAGPGHLHERTGSFPVAAVERVHMPALDRTAHLRSGLSLGNPAWDSLLASPLGNNGVFFFFFFFFWKKKKKNSLKGRQITRSAGSPKIYLWMKSERQTRVLGSQVFAPLKLGLDYVVPTERGARPNPREGDITCNVGI